MSQYSLRAKRGLLKASMLTIAALLSSSSAWAAISSTTTNSAPPQVRKISDFSTSYTESNTDSITDNTSTVRALNHSTRSVTVGYKSTAKPVVLSQVISLSQASWNKGKDRVPAATTTVTHTIFGQSFPTQLGVDKSTATALATEVKQNKQLTQSYRFIRFPYYIFGVIPIEFSVGAKGTASSEAFGTASATKGAQEKSSYVSRSTLKTGGSLELFGQLAVGHKSVAAAIFKAYFTIVSLSSSIDGSTHLAHNSAKDVRRGYGLNGAYSIGSGSGRVIVEWMLLDGDFGSDTIASWPSRVAYQNKWADDGIIVMSDAGDAW